MHVNRARDAETKPRKPLHHLAIHSMKGMPMRKPTTSAARRLTVGLAISTIAMGATMVAPRAASADQFYLYQKWGVNCKQGASKPAYDAAISRHQWDEQHIRWAFGVPTGISTARQRAFNLARVTSNCEKGMGPNLWKWKYRYFGLERGKVSRLKIGKHSCSRVGTCWPAHTITYGTWRAGWTHEKL